MAEQIPFSVIADILVKLGTSTVQEIGSAYGVGEELTALKPKLEILNGLLVDAEEKLVESHAVQAWLRRLKNVVYDADDLLDDFATFQLQRGGVARQVCDFFSSSNQVVFRFKMSNKVKQMKKEVDEIVNQIPPMLNLIEGNRVDEVESRWRDTHSFALASEIVGREENKDEIVKLLLSSHDEESLSMVAIVGIGGLGKTTLAQLVYNDKEVVQYFEPRIWVCVSDNFDVRGLIVKILKGVHEHDVERFELDGLKDLLHKKLSGKRCLLVLDDVWNENCGKWDRLKSLLMVVEKRSKILVTTRNSKVASIMGIDSPFVLEGLNEAQSWDLLSKITLKDKLDNVQPKLIKIAKEITGMCKGVPLVIKTLGSTLCSKIDENWWLSIRNNKNLLCLDAESDGVLSVLKLSYNNLPRYLKQCFTYCALFPKDYEIEKKVLVQLWMAQGYVHPLHEDVGDRYFDELLSKSLLEVFRKDDFNNILSCKMHDLIHDLAQSLVGSEIIALEDSVKEVPKEVDHVSFYEAGNLILPSLQVKQSRSFLTHVNMTYISKEDSIQGIDFSRFNGLRVLSLRKFYLQKVPKALGKLNHLRYLDLSYNNFEKLPDGITRLKNLQTLKLLKCLALKKFPKDIRELTNMRHWENDAFVRHMPCGIGRFTLLQSLPVFVVGSGRGVGRLNELKELNSLRGELKIVGLENAGVGCGDANMKAKQQIQSLRLEWGGVRLGGRDEDLKRVIEGLQPHPNLKELHISGYAGLKFPSWGMRNDDGLNSVLPNLTTLHLERWSRCRILLCVVGLPYLKSLELQGLEELEEMECSPEGPFFPSLVKLTLHRLPNLKELWRRDLPTLSPPSFSCLSQLKIRGCHNLPSLELYSSPHLSTLCIDCCPKLTSMQLPPSPNLSQLEIQNCDNLASLELHSSPLLSTLLISRCPNLTSLQLPPSPHLSQLNISTCDNLASLELHSSSRLSNLLIFSCPKLTSLQLPPSPHLSQLNISTCDNLASLELHSFSRLSNLLIFSCPKLTSFQLPPSPHLSKLEIWECDDLASLELHSSPLLSHLDIFSCPVLTSLRLPPSPYLSQLEISKCDNLTTLELHSSPLLSHLQILECPKLTFLRLPSLPGLEKLELSGTKERVLRESMLSASSLKFVNIESIDDLINLPDELLQHASTLQTITIEDCPGLGTLPHWMGNLTSLIDLQIYACPELISLPQGMRPPPILRGFSIGDLSGLTELPDWIGSLSSVEDLHITGCPQLMSLPEGMRSLRILKLSIACCVGLTVLPDWMRTLTTLKVLKIFGCPCLSERCQKGKGEDWPKIAHVPDIIIDGERVG